jgi:hypothetical protein
LEKNIDAIDWQNLSQNPAIIEDDISEFNRIKDRFINILLNKNAARENELILSKNNFPDNVTILYDFF